MTMSKLIIRRRNTIGPSHHFLRVFRKSQNSESMEILFSCLVGSSTESPVYLYVLYIIESLKSIACHRVHRPRSSGGWQLFKGNLLLLIEYVAG